MFLYYLVNLIALFGRASIWCLNGRHHEQRRYWWPKDKLEEHVDNDNDDYDIEIEVH